MFGTLGGPELFLIFVVALIVFGPRKLPDIGKSLGRMMSEFRRASNEFKSTIESEVESEKIKESMRIEPPKVTPVKATPPADASSTAEATTGAAVAASDGMDSSPEADDPAETTTPTESAAPGDEAASDTPDSPAEEPPKVEPVPETVSRQPPAATEESQ